MSKIELLELLQQDIEDIKGLIEYERCENTNDIMKTQARGILSNLQEHLTDLIEST